MFGGFRKDNGLALNTDNIFAALESRKKGSKKKDNVEALKKSTEFWTNAPLVVKSWADCEDDDDYYATAAPPVWGNDQPKEKEESDKEDSEDQEDYDIDEDVDEETDTKEDDAKLSHDVPSVGSMVLQVNKTREPEKQLSKKEIKKKELAELDKVLEEFGLLTKEKDGSNVAQAKKIEEEAKEELEIKPSEPVLANSKTMKKRKVKKEKPKEAEVGTTVIGNRQEQTVETTVIGNRQEQTGEVNKAEKSVVADPKAVLKKLASHQKKKSGKESDAAAKAAAAEAAARAAKQAAAKKKDKMHYNQHPPK